MSYDDDMQDQVHRMEQQAIANAANNSSGYVASRYFALHPTKNHPIPVSRAARNMPSQGPFIRCHKEGQSYMPGPSEEGIDVLVEDTSTGEIGTYRVESTGTNVVAITLYQGKAHYGT